jgi:hypothetical protein
MISSLVSQGLVKLGDAQDGPKTRRSRSQMLRGDAGGVHVHASFGKPDSDLLGGGLGPGALASLNSNSSGLARVIAASKPVSKLETPAVLDPAPARAGSASSALQAIVGLGQLRSDDSSESNPPALRRSKPSGKAILKAAPAQGDGTGAKPAGPRDEAWAGPGRASPAKAPQAKVQSFRGVTWDKVKQVSPLALPVDCGQSCKGARGIRAASGCSRVSSLLSLGHSGGRCAADEWMVQMWRVRLCLAGGGREHVGYFASEEAGAVAYARALERLKMHEGALPARAMERYSQEREARAAAAGTGAPAAPPPVPAAAHAASAGPPPRV